MLWARRAEKPATAPLSRARPHKPGDLLRRLRQDEQGTVTAEFAVVVPAVLVVLGLVIGGIVIATNRLTLAAAAADIARLEARGDSALANERLTAAGAGLNIERDQRGQLLCVTIRASPRSGLLGAIGITGTGCAAITELAE